MKKIAKHLNRTETACFIKAKRMKLGVFRNRTELLSITEAAEMLGIGYKSLVRIIKKGELQYKEVPIRNNVIRKFLDFNEVMNFRTSYSKQNNRKWSSYEISRLRMLLMQEKTYAEIGKILGRSRYAVYKKANRILNTRR